MTDVKTVFKSLSAYFDPSNSFYTVVIFLRLQPKMSEVENNETSARTSGIRVNRKQVDSTEHGIDSEDEGPNLVIDGDKAAKKKMDYMFLRRIKRPRRHHLDRVLSMSKSTRNARTAQLFELAEILSSQNHSQFIILSISSNPEQDTISHESYGDYATEMFHSSSGQQFIQEFISGWALSCKNYPSGVEKNSKNKDPSTSSTISEVITGACAVVRNTVSRFKKKNRFAPNHEKVIELDVDPNATEIVIDDVVYPILRSSDLPGNDQNSIISKEDLLNLSDDGHDYGEDTSETHTSNQQNNMDETVGEQSPSTPSPSPSTNSQLELVHGQDAEVPFKSSDLTESDLRSENLSDVSEDILNDSNTNIIAKRTSARISLEENRQVFIKASYPEIFNQFLQILQVLGEDERKKRYAAQTKSKTKARKARSSKQKENDIRYMCPKCKVFYDEDELEGRNVEWLKCKMKQKCDTWAHVDCVGANYICSKCK